MEDIIKVIATYGVGGALGALIFWFYRKDAADNLAKWQGQNEILLAVVRDNTSSNRENAVSNVRLVTVIEALHRKLDRDSDSHN